MVLPNTISPSVATIPVGTFYQSRNRSYIGAGALEDDEDDDPKFQSFLTGGGAGPPRVAMDTSPMIRNASLQAWYWRSISSRFMASSALSSIIDCCGRKRREGWNWTVISIQFEVNVTKLFSFFQTLEDIWKNWNWPILTSVNPVQIHFAICHLRISYPLLLKKQSCNLLFVHRPCALCFVIKGVSIVLAPALPYRQSHKD